LHDRLPLAVMGDELAIGVPQRHFGCHLRQVTAAQHIGRSRAALPFPVCGGQVARRDHALVNVFS
jgi:hypothetical protein